MTDILYETVNIELPAGATGAIPFTYPSDSTYERITGVATYQNTLHGVTHVNIGLYNKDGNAIQHPTHLQDWLSTANYSAVERYKPLGLEANGLKYKIKVVVPNDQVVGANGVSLQMVFRVERKKNC